MGGMLAGMKRLADRQAEVGRQRSRQRLVGS